MTKGLITRLETSKGYGFIRKNTTDYFFHRDDFIGHWEDLIIDYTSAKDIEVEFENIHTPKGPRAQNVRRLDHPNQSV